MGVVKFFFPLIVSAVLFSQTSFAVAGAEEQRKYWIDPSILTSDKIELIKPFVFHPHLQYTTYDIYFDTPNWDIRKSSYSLRLRRVEKKKGAYEYAIQLKTEMVELGQTRTELEFKDFSKQHVGGEKISDLMDRFIEHEASRAEITTKFSAWMKRKKDSSLAPFQQLANLEVDSKDLHPVIWGKSVRQRYHVYTAKNSSLVRSFFIKSSEKNIFLVPEYFKKKPEFIWLMEASFDQAAFKDLLSGKAGELAVNELEIENKYRPRKLGTLLLNSLEEKMFIVWKAKTNITSKYLQSVNFFYPEKK